MEYNFKTVQSRREINSPKWEEMYRYFPDLDEDIIPFSIADMEFDNPPEVREGLKAFIDKYSLGYFNVTDAFKASVVNWYQTRHDWTIQPDWILSTTGVINAFYTAINAFTRPGEGVMLMTPVYYPMYHAVTGNNRVIVDNPLINNSGRYEIDFDDFERKARDENTKLLILCSPHNPSGRVFSVEELTRIGRICIDHGVLICADEIHNDIIMPGYRHTVFASISEEFAHHSIICTAPSKTFSLAGMKTANAIIADDRLRKEFYACQCISTDSPKCNILGYEANRIAYEKCGEWLTECIGVINQNRLMIEHFLAREIPQIKLTPLEGTYLLWMDFRALGIPYEELGQLLRRDGKLFFDDGCLFGAQGNGFERWNLACPTSYIESALVRLKASLEAYLK